MADIMERMSYRRINIRVYGNVDDETAIDLVSRVVEQGKEDCEYAGYTSMEGCIITYQRTAKGNDSFTIEAIN